METTILAIDCGTQSLRTLLYSTRGELLTKEQITYQPYFSLNPGWAEQNPNVYWAAVSSGCQALKNKAPDLFQKIAGIGVTTQRNSMVCVDESGTPLRSVITWLDQRKAKAEYTPNPLIATAYKAVGMDEAIQKAQEEGKGNWIRQNEPDIWQKTHRYLQVSGYLNFLLTGEFKDSIASQIGHIPFDYKKRKWAHRDLKNRLFPVEQEKLPELVKPGELIGKLSIDAANATGLPSGTPVIACGSDKGCETLGMGVLNETMASLSFGTTATVQTTARRYYEPLKFMPPYPAPVPGKYNPEVEIFRGFWMISWFKEEFAHEEILIAKEQGISPEKVMTQLLKKSPPGSMGLITQPYWGPGLKTPSAKGAMIGFGDIHKKEHIFRSVIEGLNFALKDGLHKIEKAGKYKVRKLAVSGGASQSEEICQIAADIFNLPIVRGETHETSGLGAAIITAVGLGIHPDFETAVKEMVSYKEQFSPDQEHVEIYDQLFHQVYQKMFSALHPLYEKIRSITGYPE